MSPAPQSPPVGYYGKLPSRGDFITQRLPAGFVAAWDRWLQAGLVESKAALGEAWLDAYLSAPLWRFLLPAGIAGDRAMIGLMMASVDRAGRYFPLTLAAPAPADATVGYCFACSAWMAQLEKAALHALDEGVALEAFESGVGAIGAPPAPLTATTEDWGDGATRVTLQRDEFDPTAPFAAFAAASIYDGRAVFWTLGSPRVSPAVLLLPGLPPPARFSAMLDDVPGGTPAAAAPAAAAMPEAAAGGDAAAPDAAAPGAPGAPGAEAGAPAPEWPPAEFPPPEFPPLEPLPPAAPDKPA